MFTCERCGKQPRDSKGNHIIWQSKGWWIEQFCNECVRKSCYAERRQDYKDALLTNKPYYGGPKIKDMISKYWQKIKDDKMITVKTSSAKEEKIESWDHWGHFYTNNIFSMFIQETRK